MNTSVLGIEFKEEAKLVESAARRKEGELQKQRTREENFIKHMKIIQEYFLRMNAFDKNTFLIKLLRNVRSADSVSHMIKFMPVGFAKGYNYSKVETKTKFIYETAIVDHNRMLDKTVLEQTIASDLEWFRSLSDHNQVFLFVELLRRGGGYIRKAIAVPLMIQYFKSINASKESTDQLKTVQIKDTEIIDDDGNDDDEDQYDPTHPSSIEVERQRKKWNDIITKYRKGVEAAEHKLEARFETGERKRKGAGKGGKAGKSKSSKKSGKGKKGDEEIDRIQSVPLWIIKKIFGYLDQKSLKKLKSVNTYWAYIIEDVIADMKMRKKLDKAMEKLKAQIDPEKLEEALAVVPEKEKMKIKKSRRVQNMYDCGITSKKIIQKEMGPLVDKSLIMDVKNQIFVEKECISSASKPLLSFPRVIKDDALYKRAPCILRDVKVVLGVQDGAERHVSFLTYSLSSRMSSSVEFDVSEGSVFDW